MLGEYIKYMRLSRGLSQKELARQLYIATCTLSHYEVGTRMVPYSVFEKALKIMNFKQIIIDCRNSKELTKMEISRIK